MAELRKCDYCGRYFDVTLFRPLDNGSEACPECVEGEETKEDEEE